MKTYKFLSILMMILWMVPVTCSFGQDKEKKVHLKVIKNDQTIVDTTFSARELEEKGLQKKISELAGMDISLHDSEGPFLAFSESGSETVYMIAHDGTKGVRKIILEGDKEKKGKHHYAYVVSEDDTSRIMLKGEKIEVISEDSLKKIKVIGVDEDDLEWITEDSLKKAKPVVWVIKEGEEDLKWVTEEGKEDSIKVIIKKSGEGEKEVIHIREASKAKVYRDGEHVIVYDSKKAGEGAHKVIKVKKDNDNEKTYMIYVDADSKADIDISAHADAHVHMEKEKSGTEFASKSVMVKTRKIEGSEDVEIIVTIDEKMKKKTEKKSPESKQKK